MRAEPAVLTVQRCALGSFLPDGNCSVARLARRVNTVAFPRQFKGLQPFSAGAFAGLKAAESSLSSRIPRPSSHRKQPRYRLAVERLTRRLGALR